MLSGRNRSHVQRIRKGCPTHTEYRGKGAPPNPCCGTCLFIHDGWNELVATMNELLKD